MRSNVCCREPCQHIGVVRRPRFSFRVSPSDLTSSSQRVSETNIDRIEEPIRHLENLRPSSEGQCDQDQVQSALCLPPLAQRDDPGEQRFRKSKRARRGRCFLLTSTIALTVPHLVGLFSAPTSPIPTRSGRPYPSAFPGQLLDRLGPSYLSCFAPDMLCD
jgi:hypothetical protein